MAIAGPVSPANLNAPRAVVPLTLNSDGTWSLPLPGQTGGMPVFNVMNYGAKGDGVTDDSTAIQLAIDTIATNRYGIVYIPDGVFLIGTPLQLKSDITIMGCGDAFGYSQLRSSGDNVIIGTVNSVTAAATDVTRVTFKDIQLDHRGGTGGTSYAMDLSRLYLTRFYNTTITSGVAGSRNFKGLRIRNSDSVRFYDLHVTECRGQHFSIYYGCAQIHFYGGNFESDSGVAATWSEIDMYALAGDSAPTNYEGNGEGIAFFGTQFERINIYCNAAGVIFDNAGGSTVNYQFDKKCRRMHLRNFAAATTTLNFVSPHTILQNIDAGSGAMDGAANFEMANINDPLFRVYGAGIEYLMLAVVYARSLSVTGANCTFTANAAGLLETSDAVDFVQMNASAAVGTAARDEFCWATLLEVPAVNNYITVAAAASANTAGLKLYAFKNLLTNGDFTQGTATTSWTATNLSTTFAGGYVKFGSPAANMKLRQTGITNIKSGKKYLLMARCIGTNVQLAFGDVTDGTAGTREAMASAAAIRTANYADGSYILSCIFEATGARTDVSIGYLGTPANEIQVKWVALVELGTAPQPRASSDQPFAASFTPIYQNNKLEQVIHVGQMTANMTALNLGTTTPLAVDDLVTFIFQQDATAGRTITWNASYKFQAAWVNGVITTDASKYATVTFRWDGTAMRQVSPVNVWIA